MTPGRRSRSMHLGSIFNLASRTAASQDAINKGISRCDGEWFNWLNSDDYLTPGSLFALAAAARATTRPIVSGVTLNIGGTGLAPQYSARISSAWPGMLFNVGVNQPGSILRMASVRENGPLREELSLCMDLDLWIRLALGHGAKNRSRKSLMPWRFTATTRRQRRAAGRTSLPWRKWGFSRNLPPTLADCPKNSLGI